MCILPLNPDLILTPFLLFWVYRLFTFLFPTSCYWWHHGPSPCSLSLHWFWHSLLSHGQQTIIFFNLSNTHLLLYVEILMDISASLWFYNEQPVYKQRDSWKETSPNGSLGFFNLSDWSTPLVHNCRNPKPYVRFKQIQQGGIEAHNLNEFIMPMDSFTVWSVPFSFPMK